MRPAAFIKVLGAALAMVCAANFAAPAFADPCQDCINACIDQYDQDLQACQQALSDRLAQLDAEAAQCATQYPNDPVNYGLCIRNNRIKRASAQSDYRLCQSRANTAAYNCYRNCQVSPGCP